MIKYVSGNIFEAHTDAIINTVNTVGVMGKGIALQFKTRFPDNYKIYRDACKNNQFSIGDLIVTKSNSLFFKYIINFPTKKHWRNPSKYEYIEQGLVTLKEKIKEYNIKSIAIPPLGAGNGKLEWQKVKTILITALNDVNDVEFLIYEPQKQFEVLDNKKVLSAKLTPARALLIDCFNYYQNIDDSLNLLVSQKLAYFLQRLGEPLRLKYEKGWYGPYASNLSKVLQSINGTFITYQSQNDKPGTKVKIIESNFNRVISFYNEKLNQKQLERSKLLKDFIDGFETPFSLEILATVDWILNEHPNYSVDQVYNEIANWTKRKADLIKQHHVNVAFNHLKCFNKYFA